MSRANRLRRERNRLIRTADRIRMAGNLEELQAADAVRAIIGQQMADEDLAALIAEHKPAQIGRLRAAGYVLRIEGYDGAGCWDQPKHDVRIIASAAREDDGNIWGHVSVSRRDDRLPTWEQLRDAQWLIYPGRTGLIVVAPQAEHVNLGEVAHVWTCLTAGPVPDFTRGLSVL